MKYFEKIAAGPVINITKDPTKKFYGEYMEPSMVREVEAFEGPRATRYKKILNKNFTKKQQQVAKEKGAIYGNIGKDPAPWTSKSNIKKHELTHHIRGQKGKWSFNKYFDSRIARFIEETAAHKRGGENIGRSIQGGLAAAVGVKSKIYNLLKKIK
jgi:hypothetical protein